VHRREIGQVAEGLRTDQLPAAACIRRIVLQHEPAHTVRDARLDPLESGIVAAAPLARDDAEPAGRARCDQRLPEERCIVRVILPVAVEQLHPVSAYGLEPREQRGGFPSPLHMRQHRHRVRMRRFRLRKLYAGRVAGRIVDADHLEIDPRQHGMHLVDHGMHIARLIEEGDQHGKGRGLGHSAPA